MAKKLKFKLVKQGSAIHGVAAGPSGIYKKTWCGLEIERDFDKDAVFITCAGCKRLLSSVHDYQSTAFERVAKGLGIDTTLVSEAAVGRLWLRAAQKES